LIPVVVWALIVANAVVFVAGRTATDPATLVDAFAAVPYNITHGIVLPAPSPPLAALTMLSAMFVHAGLTHVALNMLFLFACGPAIEARCGHLRFAAFYLLCGIAGELLQIAVAPGSHLPAVGASGAIAGVMGAYLVSFPFRWPALIVIGAWAATEFAAGFAQLTSHLAGYEPGDAPFIHIGGFACGVLLVGRFRRPDAGMRPSSW